MAINRNTALVADWLTNVGGSEKVVWQLHEMFPDAPIFTTVFDAKRLALFKDIEVKTSFLQSLPLSRKKHQWFVPLMPAAIGSLDFSNYDLIISSSHTVGHGIKKPPKAIHICYCHTPLRWAWEPSIDSLGERLPLGPLTSWLAAYFRWWDKRHIDSVDLFVANSNYIRERIKKHYDRDAKVVYPPVDVDHIPLNTNKKEFFLLAGRLIAYKKPDLIVEAFNRLGWPLKVVGEGPMRKQLEKTAKPNVEFLGFQDDATLHRLYGEARGFVFAALEDFGITPVEAMAAGTPVIGYGKGGLLETVKDGETGIYFKEQTIESLIDALKKFESMSFSASKLRSWAQNFSNDKFKTRMSKVIEDVLNGR